jgi:hypothetical protein
MKLLKLGTWHPLMPIIWSVRPIRRAVLRADAGAQALKNLYACSSR